MDQNKQGASIIDTIMRFKWGIVAIVAGLVIGLVVAKIRSKDVLTFAEGTAISMYAGTQQTLTIESKKGKTYTSSDLAYEISDPSIVDVSVTGTVRALKPGTATISCKKVKGRCDPAVIDVTVEQDILTLNNNESVTLTIGKSQKLGVTSRSGIEYDASKLHFTSTNRSVVEIDQDGTIKAVGEGYSQVSVQTSDGTSTTSSVGVTVKLKKVAIESGKMLKTAAGSKVAPLKIKVGKGQNYYLYFKNSKTPSNSFAFYLKSGKSKTMNVPLGTYTLYYATGKTWYGKKYKFGNATSYHKLDKKVKFYISGNRYMGHSIKLYSVENGNVTTSGVGEGEFPG